MADAPVRTTSTRRTSCTTSPYRICGSGALTADETVVDGFDRIVDAFLLMLRGGNTGKILVRKGDRRASYFSGASRLESGGVEAGRVGGDKSRAAFPP